MLDYVRYNFQERTLFKKILKHSLTISVIARIAAKYILFVYKTTRWQWVNRDIMIKYQQSGKPFLVAFWHNRLLMTTFGWQSDRPFNMLISAHGDGKIIAQTVGHHGIKTIAGSKRHGGSQALREICKTLKEGEVVGITPDGPRGPRMRASDGIAMISRLTGCDVITLAYSVKRRVVISSWDRFILALPFTKGIMVYGTPVKGLKRDSTQEETEHFRLEVEKTLTEITDQADISMGHVPIKPSEVE